MFLLRWSIFKFGLSLFPLTPYPQRAPVPSPTPVVFQPLQSARAMYHYFGSLQRETALVSTVLPK